MNKRAITYILGWILKVEGIFMLLPVITAGIYKEWKYGLVYLMVGLAAGTAGFCATRRKPDTKSFYAREGFVTVALGWILMSLVGGLPFYLTGEIPHFPDAMFEIVSGFTTTGASVLSDVEKLSHGTLIWRSFSHWLGGMGVLVFVLTVMPLAGGQTFFLMKAESPGPSVSKLVPKLRMTALVLYGIYIAMTLGEIFLLLLGRMPLFDALCTAFGTAGTGGFGIKNDSMGGYSPYIQIVVTVFMMLFGVNFSVYYLMLIRKFKEAVRIEEVKAYFLIYFVMTLLIAVNITEFVGHFSVNLRHAAFQAASIMTTTGFATVNFDTWPQFSKTIMIILMFVGACAGSTGGGIKVSRILIYVKTIGKELSFLIHPRSVKVVKMDGRKMEHTVVRAANIFLIAYIGIYTCSVLLIGLDNFGFTTNFTAVAATLNNIGPGLELVGPTGNYGMFSSFSKFVLMFDMLAGRLEVFPMLLLFTPATWRK